MKFGYAERQKKKPEKFFTKDLISKIISQRVLCYIISLHTRHTYIDPRHHSIYNNQMNPKRPYFLQQHNVYGTLYDLHSKVII